MLENAGYSFPRVAGTSAGSIVGAQLTAGMPASRITEIMAIVDYHRFADRSPGPRSRRRTAAAPSATVLVAALKFVPGR